MAEVREPGGFGFKIFAVLGIVFFLAVVGLLIRSYDKDDTSEVASVGPPVTVPVGTGSAAPPVEAPVGAVATGGGGMAGGDGANLAVPVLVGVVGLVGITMLTAGGFVLRRREA